jgi:tRNA/rRNA methyltransferase
LESARVVDTAAEAIAASTFVVATTGTPRQLDKPLIGPREAVARIRAAMKAGEKPVILFGSERAGLDNDLIIGADVLVTYPVDGRFPSLNLAQSVACFCYEWASFSEAEGPPPGWTMEEKPAAPRHAFESFFQHWVDELEETRFFWPEDRKGTMVETLRNAFVRGRFTMGEVSLIRGALRSLAGGPRRRAIETDAADTRAIVESFLAQQSGEQPEEAAKLVEIFGGRKRLAALVERANGERGIWLISIDDKQISSAQFSLISAELA